MLKDILSRILKPYVEGIGTVFMLHRVSKLNSYNPIPNEDLKISPQYLEDIINHFKKKAYTFISLDELYYILTQKKNNKKLIVFTLDDGYLDNYTIAYPIFKSYNIPFTIYITNSFPNKTAILWWYLLEDIILNNDEIAWDKNKILVCDTPKKKKETFLNLRKEIISYPHNILREKVHTIFNKFNISANKYILEQCMDWKHIIDLSKDPLVTIGGHTINHFILKNLNKDEAFAEIDHSKKEIEAKISKKIDHFAYPFGSPNEISVKDIKLVKEAGYKTATTTIPGNIFPDHNKFLHSLPRIYLFENNMRLNHSMYWTPAKTNKLKHIIHL